MKFYVIPAILIASLLYVAWVKIYSGTEEISLREIAILHLETIVVVESIEKGELLGSIIEETDNFPFPLPTSLVVDIDKSIETNGLSKTLLALNESLYSKIQDVHNYKEKLANGKYGICLSRLLYMNYILTQIENGISLDKILNEADPSYRKRILAMYDISQFREDISILLYIENHIFAACINELLKEENKQIGIQFKTMPSEEEQLQKKLS